jgi:uncharacterized protein (DUF58 family)
VAFVSSSPTGALPSLDPRVLARVSNLSLRARLVVDGVLSGLHRSPQHGSSVEFAEHKEYSPGDEIRHLDWKRYARTDRYTVKRFEEETNLRALLVLDGSGSMDFGSGALSKWAYSVTLALSLAYLLLRQSDAVGMAVATADGERYVPPRSDSAHLHALIHTLEGFRPAGALELAAALDTLAGRMRRRGLLIVITDGLDGPESTLKALGRLRHRHHEVVVFQVLDPVELSFPFDELTRFESPEDGTTVLSDPRLVRREYLARLRAHNQALSRGCRAHEIDLVSVDCSEPPDHALVRYLAARS